MLKQTCEPLRGQTLFLAAAFACAVLWPGKVEACIISVETKLEDVRAADFVVVGRISQYRIVRDEAFRKEMLSDPHLSREDRKLYQGNDSLMSDYARFEISVEEVLKGNAPSKMMATWDNSTFGEPEKLPSGPFLIALRKSGSDTLPLRGPSATIMPDPEPGTVAVLQAPCASPFLFLATSEEARRIRTLLKPK